MAHDSHAHDGHDHAPHSVSHDRRPAYIGLVAGAMLIGAILFGMVKWTNSRFASHGEPAAGGNATTPAATH